MTYEVTCELEADRTAAFERFMRERHIPDLLATGCFQGAELLQSEPGRYQVRYHAATLADLDRYFSDHAPRLRAEFQSRVSGGVQLSRETWVTVQRW